ncbi:MAG: hypothetical protein ACRDTD_10115 [Pseudonocardiaceae bacterium]
MAEIAAMPSDQQPCYVKEPRYREPVPEARLGDLDSAALARTLERFRVTSPSLRDVDDDTALRRINP